MSASRAAAVVTLAVLVVSLAAVTLLATPWRPLGSNAGASPTADPQRDFSAAERAREDAYHRAVRPPAYAGLALGLLVPLVLAATGAGARLVTALARPLGGGWAWKVVFGVLAVLVLSRLLRLPFDARVEVVRRRFGLSTRSWTAWAADMAKSLVLSSVLLVAALLAVWLLIRALPRWWWAPGAAGAAALVVALTFAFPLVVEPLFNRFTPMPPGPLRASLLDLAQRDGVAVDEVLVADASRRTTALNAYVSGLGATRRIVVYDTLLAGSEAGGPAGEAAAAEVRSVVAHELGHVRHADVRTGTLVAAGGAAATVCLLYLVLASPAVLRRAGATDLADGRAVILVLAAALLIGAVTTPVQLLVSRRIEARADVHALELTGDPATFIAMQRRLSVANLADLDPSPWVYALFSSHPTGPQRIALARAWAAARAG